MSRIPKEARELIEIGFPDPVVSENRVVKLIEEMLEKIENRTPRVLYPPNDDYYGPWEFTLTESNHTTLEGEGLRLYRMPVIPTWPPFNIIDEDGAYYLRYRLDNGDTLGVSRSNWHITEEAFEIILPVEVEGVVGFSLRYD